MPSTYTWKKALDVVSQSVRGQSAENIGPTLADLAQSMIWNAGDWRQSLKTLPPFFLYPEQQDYAQVPADFLGLREANVADVLANPVYRSPINPVRYIESNFRYGIPQEPDGLICYQADLNAFRVWPIPPSATPLNQYQIEGRYKKTATKITADNLASEPIPFDDAYFSVAVAALKYQYLYSLGSPAAGQVIYDRSGNARYSGELAVAYDLINRMSSDEGVNLGTTAITPRSPLVTF